jgi:hypothetical protein
LEEETTLREKYETLVEEAAAKRLRNEDHAQELEKGLSQSTLHYTTRPLVANWHATSTPIVHWNRFHQSAYDLVLWCWCGLVEKRNAELRQKLKDLRTDNFVLAQRVTSSKEQLNQVLSKNVELESNIEQQMEKYVPSSRATATTTVCHHTC